jgi:hypothetical protein
VVPRLRIGGQLGSLSVAGEAYFALTPSCLMGGIRFQAVFVEGGLRAAFLAYADFVMAWAPFAYKAEMGVALAISYNFSGSAESGGGLTLKLELYANLQISGPPLAGTATISSGIFCITVAFGTRRPDSVEVLGWDQFKTQLLPPAGADQPDKQALCAIRVTEGTVREIKDANGKTTHRIVNPHELMIETDSFVPCSTVTLGVGKGASSSPEDAAPVFGIRPMAVEPTPMAVEPERRTKLRSVHTVEIKHRGNDKSDLFVPVRLATKNFPEALWSPVKEDDSPKSPGLIKNVPSGVVLKVRATTPEQKHALGPIPAEKFKYSSIPKKIVFAERRLPSSKEVSGSAFEEDLGQKMEKRQKSIRTYLESWGQSRSWNKFEAKLLTREDAAEHFQVLPRPVRLGTEL